MSGGKARDVDAKIGELFDSNYRQMLAEGGVHVLTPRALAQARQQVEQYWKKMRDIAINVTETEVKIQLPNRVTPKQRKFVIEGVVDLVREGDRLRMYDIKTHFCEEVRRNCDSYAAQLNVYAYVWRELRGQVVHEMGIIAIQLPEALRMALRDGDLAEAQRHSQTWNPLVPIASDPGSLDAIFQRIAETVDRIEDGEFAPPPASELASTRAVDENLGGRKTAFATLHCRNCDGRFSCDSYREYVRSNSKSGKRLDVLEYVDGAHDDGELDAWIDENLGDTDGDDEG